MIARLLVPLRNLGANGRVAVRWVLARAVLPRGPGFWLRVVIRPPLSEIPMPRLLPGPPPSPGLLAVLQSLESACDDPQVLGVFVKIEAAPGGLAKVSTLRRALEAVRAAGKPVVAWGERWGAEELLLASAATRVLMPEAGSVHLVGVRLESFFLKDLLATLGVEPDVVRVGDFKTAGELLTRSGMSPEQREQLEAVLDDVFGALVEGLAAGRGLERERVRQLVDEGPYDAPGAVKAGLVDACLFPDEVEEVLRSLAGTPPEPSGRPGVRVVEVAAYHALRGPGARWRPLLGETPRVAYVVAEGAIRPGGGAGGIRSEGFRRLLRELEEDAGVRAVVLRVESPGGDALASDLLWRAVRRLAAEKPVVVSMGEVAASGGYYLAAGADAILAEQATLTGSIGVVGGKLSLRELYERVGVGREGVERGARAGLLSTTRPFTAEERALVREQMRGLYERFVARVAEGRGMTVDAVRAVAGGRVWSGTRARDAGLVDALGGPLEALAEARRRAGLRPRDLADLDLRPRRPRLPSLLRSLRESGWSRILP